MAIDKELYKRYKELKAQGVNITLAELKAGVVNTATSQSESPQQTTYYNSISPAERKEFVNEQSELTNSREGFTQQTNSQSPYTGNVRPNGNQYQNYMTQFSQTAEYQTQPAQEFHGNVSPAETTPLPLTKFGLLGYPLGHSLSTYIHEAGFKSLGLDYTYELLETSPENLVERVKQLKYGGYAGFNVTIPLKLPITMFLDEIDDSADVVGAVNTVVINQDRTLKGYNTDVLGFRNAIPNDVILNGKTAGVLGTGGAARAAIAALTQMGIKSIKIFTRNIPNSMKLLNYLEEHYTDTEFNVYQIEHIRNLSDIDILVNCTPIGMQGRGADYTPVEEKELCTLPQGAIVYDVIYNPKRTILLKLAAKNGYRTINGLDMLVSQAVESEKIWTGRTPDFKDMKIAALENL